MNTQENKELIRNYFEARSGRPKPPRNHIAMNEATFPGYELDLRKRQP